MIFTVDWTTGWLLDVLFLYMAVGFHTLDCIQVKTLDNDMCVVFFSHTSNKMGGMAEMYPQYLNK